MLTEPRIFISFTTADEVVADFVRRLLIELNQQNLSPWIYESPQGEIEFTLNIADVCEEEIDKCELFIPIVSDKVFLSPYAIGEVEYFLETQNNRLLFPIILTDSSDWISPYDKLKGIKGYSRSSKLLQDSDISLDIENIVQKVCQLFNIEYIQVTKFNNRFPLKKKILTELQGIRKEGEKFKTDKLDTISDLCFKIEESYNNRNYKECQEYIKGLYAFLDLYFPNTNLYYLKIVEGILDVEDSIISHRVINPLENNFQRLIEEKHKKLDENAYAGLAQVYLLYGNSTDALLNYKLAENIISNLDVALLYNILLSKILSSKKIEDVEVEELEQYLEKGIPTQEKDSLGRIFYLYILYLCYIGDVDKAISQSKSSDYKINNSIDLLLQVIENILDFADRKHDSKYLDKAIDLIDYILSFKNKLPMESIFYLYTKKAWIFYDKGSTNLNKAIDILYFLKEEYPNSMIVLRDLIIMLIENKKIELSYNYCIELQNYKSVSDVYPIISLGEFEYIRGFSFWLLGKNELADECFIRSSFKSDRDYFIEYSWIKTPIQNNKSIEEKMKNIFKF